MKHKRNLIEDNKRGENQSFLYFLHEEKKFDVKALDDLCHYIIELDTISLEQVFIMAWIIVISCHHPHTNMPPNAQRVLYTPNSQKGDL